MTVIVRDPDRRRRQPLAVHAGPDHETARELEAIYCALGYPSMCITLDADDAKDEAA